MNKYEPRVYVIKLPMRIRTSSKKVTALNLNVYRNLHFRSLNALKNKYEDIALDLIKKAGIPPLGRIQLSYRVFPKNRKLFDVSNICSIVDKFFSDALVHAKIIEDDNYTIIDSVLFGFGEILTEECVLVTITEIEPRKVNPMRILLDEDEIQQALETYVETMGLDGVTGVELSATSDGQITAEIIKELTNSTVKTRTTQTKRKGGRPVGSKNKPKEADADVDESGEDSDASDSEGNDDGTDESGENEAETAKGNSDASDIFGSPKKEKKEPSGKNLFGDEDSQSSESDSPEETEGNTTKEVKARKPSIFDQ